MALGIAASLMVCGCETITQAVTDYFKDKEDDLAPTLAATYFDGPRVRVGVVLIVQVSTLSQAPTTMQAQVDQDGNIVLPLLLQKPVHCDGLTLKALTDKLVQEYAVYYKQPQIMVMFAPFDAKGGSVSPYGTITVLGEVGSPGPVNVPSTRDLTVTKVIHDAGGLKPFADKHRIRVTRCDKDGNQTRFIVDFEEIGKDGRIDKDLRLCAGDVVWVPQTWY